MRKIDDSPIYNTIIDACISEITNNLVKEDEKALFETVGTHGERLNSPEDRAYKPRALNGNRVVFNGGGSHQKGLRAYEKSHSDN